MRRLSRTHAGGFTRKDLVMCIFAVVILAAFLGYPALREAKQKADRISCVCCLKGLGTAYRLWANDNGEKIPSEASITNGGWRELLVNSNAGPYCWTNYAIMREGFGESPGIVVCPADERKRAANFIVKGTTNDTGNAAFKDNWNVSYFVGVGASDLYPQSLAGGDRNLGPGLTPDPDYGYSPANGQGNDVILSNTSVVSWSLKMHSNGLTNGAGNILLGDGSGQQCSSAAFRQSWLRNAELGTNGHAIRLVFP